LEIELTKQNWESLIIRAVHNADRGDSESLELLALHLEEVDEAKQVLRDKGYGWTGLSILETVQSEVKAIN
jgi:hypothetical protein